MQHSLSIGKDGIYRLRQRLTDEIEHVPEDCPFGATGVGTLIDRARPGKSDTECSCVGLPLTDLLKLQLCSGRIGSKTGSKLSLRLE